MCLIKASDSILITENRGNPNQVQKQERDFPGSPGLTLRAQNKRPAKQSKPDSERREDVLLACTCP